MNPQVSATSPVGIRNLGMAYCVGITCSALCTPMQIGRLILKKVFEYIPICQASDCISGLRSNAMFDAIANEGAPIVKATGYLSRNKSRKNCAIPPGLRLVGSSRQISRQFGARAGPIAPGRLLRCNCGAIAGGQVLTKSVSRDCIFPIALLRRNITFDAILGAMSNSAFDTQIPSPECGL